MRIPHSNHRSTRPKRRTGSTTASSAKLLTCAELDCPTPENAFDDVEPSQACSRKPEDDLAAIDFPANLERTVQIAVKRLSSFPACCLWCGRGYAVYTRKIEANHLAYHCLEAPLELQITCREQLKSWSLVTS